MTPECQQLVDALLALTPAHGVHLSTTLEGGKATHRVRYTCDWRPADPLFGRDRTLLEINPRNSQILIGVRPREFHPFIGRTVLVADIDTRDQWNKIGKLGAGLRPSAVVLTGSVEPDGFEHCYVLWFLNRIAVGQQGDEIAQRLDRFIGGDRSSDISRAIPLPGSINAKNGRRVRLVFLKPERRYSPEWVSRNLDRIGAPAYVAPESKTAVKYTPVDRALVGPALAKLPENLVDRVLDADERFDGDRSRGLFSAIRTMINASLSDDEIAAVAMLTDKAQERGEDFIREEIARAHASADTVPDDAERVRVLEVVRKSDGAIKLYVESNGRRWWQHVARSIAPTVLGAFAVENWSALHGREARVRTKAFERGRCVAHWFPGTNNPHQQEQRS